MYLAHARLHEQGPFEELSLDFRDADGVPRRCTVIYGEPGTGKTTICEAIGLTRPGRAVAVNPADRREGRKPYSVLDWVLFPEDEQRPHPLRVVTPTASLSGDDEPLRRREQSHFDREAAKGSGYCFVSIPGVRYFTRPSLALLDPGRTMRRYDVRSSSSSADSSRFDLARGVKQVLAYAGLAQALATQPGKQTLAAENLGSAMDCAVSCVAALCDFTYRGLDPLSFEPLFEGVSGDVVHFDALPNQARNLIAIVAIPVRALWAAFDGADPRQSAGLVVVDDAELYLSRPVAAGVVEALRQALPAVQWILATGSADLASSVETDCLKTLRRAPNTDAIEVHTGPSAVTH